MPDGVRRSGDWEACSRIGTLGRAAGSALRVHQVPTSRPIVSIGEVQRRSGLSRPAAGAAFERLVDPGMVREITGRRRDRLFAYQGYLEIFDAGTAP